MNISLTLNCNNHCPYCFQGNINDKNMNFTLENLEKVLQWAHCPSNLILHILGGEPTIYPYFIESIELIKKYYPNNKLLIITNLLGKEKNIQYINSILSSKIGLLINTTIDDDKKELFNNRLSIIYENKYINLVTLSITLTQNKILNQKYISDTVKIFNNYPNFKLLRIGLEIPGAKHTWQKYNYDEDFSLLMETLPSQVKILPDCNWPICLLSLEIEQSYQSRFLFNPIRFGCTNPPIDILPNLSVKYCFGSNDNYIIPNILTFSNYLLLLKYLKKIETIHKPKSKDCQKCKYYLEHQCFPCHSFDDVWI